MAARARSRGRIAVGGAALAVLALGACGGSGSDGGASSATTRPPGRPSTTTTAAPDRSGAAPVTVTVFRGGEDGYASFRIPAVVRTRSGDLLAFAEGRRGSAADDGDVDLVLKRSRDDGRSWGPLDVVAEDGTDFVGNPAPVVDAATGRVVVLATHKAGTDTELEILTGTGEDSSRIWLLASDDDGRTWARPKDITASVKPATWRWYTVGPGHAIQLAHGAHRGRLVAAANHTDADKGAGDHVLVSDDGGQTWRVGADDTPQSDLIPDENAVAELPDGSLLFSSRNQKESAPWHRLQARSADGGATFDPPYAMVEGLTVPVVQGSILWAGGAHGRLLFAAPADQHDRVDLTVRTSSDEGATWSAGTRIASGPSGYSDLVELPDHRIGVLHEAGERDSAERIDLTVIGLDRIR